MRVLHQEMGSNSKRYWVSNEMKSLAKDLHSAVKIDAKEWHRLKSNSDRRAAETISAALILLLEGGKKSEVNSLINQSAKWLNGEVKAPSCPDH